MRLRSLQADNSNNEQPGAANDDNFERPVSERSQATTSNRGGGGAIDGLPRSSSRRTLLEPLRAGEEIYSPPHPPAASLATRTNNMIRPPVPVERLDPVPEEQP